MADQVCARESNTVITGTGEAMTASSGSESTACIKRLLVNVGDPSDSHREESIG